MPKCKNCNKEFIKNSNSQVHCSKICREQYKRKRYIERGGYGKVICPVCNKEFVKKHSYIKHCSPECGRIANIKYKELDTDLKGIKRKKERHKLYMKKWYKNKDNKKKHIERVNICNSNIKKRNKDYKESLDLICSECGENDINCLDFHHINPEEKDFTISFMLKSGYSIKRIQKEIEKCVVLCANCHRKHHSKNK
jgi:hypothetical protein